MQSINTVPIAILAGFLVACGDSPTSPLITSRYTVTMLAGGAPFVAAALNNAGQVVGRVTVGINVENVLINDGTTTDLGSCWATGINSQGAVSCLGGSVWRDGRVTPANFPAGFSGGATGIDDDGITAGGGYYPFIPDSTACYSHSCGYIATATRVTLIDEPTGVHQVNVPRIDNGTDVIVFTWSGQAAPTAAIWEMDSTSRPYACAGLPSNSSLNAVGGNHEVVGIAVLTDDRTKTDAIVCRDGAMESLGVTTREAHDISKSGLIVGDTDDGHGFLWAAGKLIVLDQGLAVENWHVVSAQRVNDAGQIVVTASDGSGHSETLLLTPR
jgi:hypothetical protein